MTEQEAKEMIEKICKWLEEGAPGAVVDCPYESVAVDLARDFCDKLLSSKACSDGATPRAYCNVHEIFYDVSMGCAACPPRR